MEANLCWFFIICLYRYCRWRSSYQECWDPINRFNNAIFVCPSRARNWISNAICHGLFVFSEFSWDERWLLVLLILMKLMTTTV